MFHNVSFYVRQPSLLIKYYYFDFHALKQQYVHIWSNTIKTCYFPSFSFSSAPHHINVILVFVSINLYETGGPVTLQNKPVLLNCSPAESQKLGRADGTRKVRTRKEGAREEGCLSISGIVRPAAAAVGSPVGKIAAVLWSEADTSIIINERKRPVRAHKRGKENPL